MQKYHRLTPGWSRNSQQVLTSLSNQSKFQLFTFKFNWVPPLLLSQMIAKPLMKHWVPGLYLWQLYPPGTWRNVLALWKIKKEAALLASREDMTRDCHCQNDETGWNGLQGEWMVSTRIFWKIHGWFLNIQKCKLKNSVLQSRAPIVAGDWARLVLAAEIVGKLDVQSGADSD